MQNRRTTPDEIPACPPVPGEPREDSPLLFTSPEGVDQPEWAEMHNPHYYYHYKHIYNGFFDEGRNL